MEINAIDLLNEDQKMQLSDIVFKKIKAQIQNIKFSEKEIDLASIIEDDIKMYINNGDGFFQTQDADKVGDEIANLLVRVIKRSAK